METKSCPRCKRVYPIDNAHFKFKKNYIGVLKPTYCRDCWNKYMRGGRKVIGLYKRDPVTHVTSLSVEHKRNVLKEGRRRNKIRRMEKCRELIKSHLATNPCKDCGYSNWIALEFDHRDPKEKLSDISYLLKLGNYNRLLIEIEKCDIVCRNCHSIRTATMFGSWRL